MELNHYLDTVRMKVLQIHRELEQDGKPITADVLKRRYYGEGDSPKMLLEVFQEHNRKYRELMGKDYVAGTVLRYERTARYLGELLQKEYRMNDIPLKEINHEFIARFEHYVKTEKSCAQNATVKYLKNFKKIIKVALVNKWITDDPFLEIHFKQTKTNRAFLTEEELNILLKKEFTIPRLQTVRDIFVFCALTGLAFTDVQHLRYEHIIKDINGEYWIRKAREKTDNMRDIPLLDIPRMILEKYKTHPECLKMQHEDGVRKIIITPHYRRRMFETPAKKVHEQFLKLQEAAKKEYPDMSLYLGCELHSNMDLQDILEKRKYVTMAGSSYVLLEFSEGDSAQHIRERVYNVLSCGYEPIIAHVERYQATVKSVGFSSDLVDMGARLQVNVESILGKYTWGAKRYCRKLMKEDLLSFVGSDSHNTKTRIPNIGAGAAYVSKKMGEAYANRIFHDNPLEILRDAGEI